MQICTSLVHAIRGVPKCVWLMDQWHDDRNGRLQPTCALVCDGKELPSTSPEAPTMRWRFDFSSRLWCCELRFPDSETQSSVTDHKDGKEFKASTKPIDEKEIETKAPLPSSSSTLQLAVRFGDIKVGGSPVSLVLETKQEFNRRLACHGYTCHKWEQIRANADGDRFPVQALDGKEYAITQLATDKWFDAKQWGVDMERFMALHDLDLEGVLKCTHWFMDEQLNCPMIVNEAKYNTSLQAVLDALSSRDERCKSLIKEKTVLSWLAAWLETFAAMEQLGLVHGAIHAGAFFIPEQQFICRENMPPIAKLHGLWPSTRFVGVWKPQVTHVVAPERLRGESHHDVVRGSVQSDLWSVGYVLLDVLRLNQDTDAKVSPMAICDGAHGVTNALSDTVKDGSYSTSLEAALAALLTFDVTRRPRPGWLLKSMAREEFGKTH